MVNSEEVFFSGSYAFYPVAESFMGCSNVAWLARRRATPSSPTKNPECECVQDFYFLPIHYSLFTKNAFRIFESKK